MNWSPLQHETLEAMGFAIYRMPEVGSVPQATPEPASRPMATSPAGPSASMPVSMPASRPSAARTPAHTGAGGSADDRLQAALLRAAGGVDPATLVAALAAALGATDNDGAGIGRLRGDPAAKRALWPRLRALRRRRG